jgi:hypothetical protein
MINYEFTLSPDSRMGIEDEQNEASDERCKLEREASAYCLHNINMNIRSI